MKYLFTAILIAFIAIGVFGFIAMEHGSEFAKCVSAVVPGGMTCMQNDPGMGVLHAKIFKSFSFGILTSLLLLVLFLFFQKLDVSKLEQLKQTAFRSWNLRLSNAPTYNQKLTNWIGLTEKKEDTLS